MKELLLALPRLARMLVSLAGDRDVPTAAKVVLAAVVVDGVINFIERPLLLRYWPGSPASLDRIGAVASRLARWVPSRVKSRIFGARRAA